MLHRRLLAYYEEHIAVLTRPYPQVLAVLDALAARGARLAIVTNKLEGLARKVLDALDLTRRFDCIIGGDTMGPGNAKPSPKPIYEMLARCGGGTAVFVGDSIFDIRAGQAAGLPTVACAFGFLMQPVEELGADAIIHGYADLMPTLERLATADARPA